MMISDKQIHHSWVESPFQWVKSPFQITILVDELPMKPSWTPHDTPCDFPVISCYKWVYKPINNFVTGNIEPICFPKI